MSEILLNQRHRFVDGQIYQKVIPPPVEDPVQKLPFF